MTTSTGIPAVRYCRWSEEGLCSNTERRAREETVARLERDGNRARLVDHRRALEVMEAQ